VKHWLVRLQFRGPAHFGEAGIGQERTNATVRSDTLYSAIWSIWARYGLLPAIGELLGRFWGPDVPFRLSSAFLYDRETYYLPRPSLPPPPGLEQEGKLVKKTRNLPLPLFVAWVTGARIDPVALKEARGRYGQLYHVNLRPRVQLDRETQRSELYQVAQVTFREGAGLWFLVALADDSLLLPLQHALELLGQDGLGGRRSGGYGAFAPSWVEPASDRLWKSLLGSAEADSPCCLLSLCNPAPDELPALLDGARYELVDRQGWAASGNKLQAPRKPVRMLAEGSVLGHQPHGRVVDVTPPGFAEMAGHSIYRSGLALAVPVRREERP